jgi:hypothetical protein
MPQRYGIDNSSFDVSDVDRYLARNKPQKTTSPSMTHEVKRDSDEWTRFFGDKEIDEKFLVEVNDRGNLSFTDVAPSSKKKGVTTSEIKPGTVKYKGIQARYPGANLKGVYIEESSTGNTTFTNIKGTTSYEYLNRDSDESKMWAINLGIHPDGILPSNVILKKSSDGSVSPQTYKEEEADTEFKYYTSDTADIAVQKKFKQFGADKDDILEHNIKTDKWTVSKTQKAKKAAAAKPSDEKLYADNFGRSQWKQDAKTGDWKTKFIKQEGGQRAEDRFENIAQELNRKGEDGKYVNDTKYHKRLRNTLNSYYGGRDPEYLAKISKDIASRGKVDATDDFSINTEYGQNIDKMLQRYTLHVDDAGVKSIKYQESSQDRISKQAPLASILNLFKSAKDDKALIWTKDDQSYYDEKRDREEEDGTEVFTDDDIPEADLPKFNKIPDPDGGFKFVANPEYLNYTEKLTSTENAQLAALNQSLDRNLNTLMDVAPNIYRDLNTAGKISPDILYNQGQVLLNSLIQSQKSE